MSQTGRYEPATKKLEGMKVTSYPPEGNRLLNWLKRYLGAFLATLALFVVYFIARVIKTPLWWVKVPSFKYWNHALPEHVEDKVDKIIAEQMYKTRERDMLLMFVLMILTPVYIFVPLFWFLTVIGTLAMVIFIIVTFIFFRIRTKRIKKEREELKSQ